MKSRFIIILLLCSSCISAQRGGNKKGKGYHENLSKVEPRYTYNLDSLLMTSDSVSETVVTKYDVTIELDTILDSIYILNKNIKFIRGYKVLAYSGSSQQEALEIRKQILNAFSRTEDFKDEKTDFVWHQPTFRVYIGEYQKRLAAVRMSEFLKSYPFSFSNENIVINPLVVPSEIRIRE